MWISPHWSELHPLSYMSLNNFSKKSCSKVCQVKNKAYLCNRNRETNGGLKEKLDSWEDDLVAQLVEQMTLNHWVEGSSPSQVTQSWWKRKKDDLVAQLVEQMTLNHWVEGSSPSQVTPRKGGRVVDYSGLENRRTERYRGFESLPFRNSKEVLRKRSLLFLLYISPKIPSRN